MTVTENKPAAPKPEVVRRRSMLRRVVKNVKQNVTDSILQVLPEGEMTAKAYYGATSRAFNREQRAVMAGRRRHKKTGKMDGTRFLLRRNTHRLEKGLLMRPRRSVFAADYITETVNAYVALSGRADLTDDLQWASDVLSMYFDAVGEHPTIDAARAKFIAIEGDTNGEYRQPYNRVLGESPVAFNDLLKLAKHRRSVRWFEQREVPRELIDEAMQVALQSPSACNRQPFHFRIYDDPELVQKVVSIPMGTAGYRHNIPTVIVVTGELRAFFSERDRHVIYIDASLASMALMFALESLGLSTCSINWPDVRHLDARMAKLLKLDDDERVVMLLAVGYPDAEGMVAYSQKRPVEEMRSYNRIGGS